MHEITELIRAAEKIFGRSPVLVEAALKATGRKTFTLDEAKLIVTTFAESEVKR